MGGLLILPTTVDSADVSALLHLAVGGESARLAAALEQYRSGRTSLVGATVDGALVGIAGFRIVDNDIVLVHIATRQTERRRGIGTALVDYVRSVEPTLPIVAETDQEGVAFYRANGFTVRSLGEIYPGVERFQVRRAP
ncbi:GNAT family N-acetyltransferase [Antrihabitans spumae]|uniref:GNAT family N-acetyltransferase n=1 Tax=Antrihabitans spumae TaxID=3373370 RepID=A0ABW7KKD8_9NOCA